MSLKANYEKAKKLLVKDTVGIWWYRNGSQNYAKITTYGEFLKNVKEAQDKGDFYKTFEYGWRDGRETSSTLYTHFLIDADSRYDHAH